MKNEKDIICEIEMNKFQMIMYYSYSFCIRILINQLVHWIFIIKLLLLMKMKVKNKNLFNIHHEIKFHCEYFTKPIINENYFYPRFRSLTKILQYLHISSHSILFRNRNFIKKLFPIYFFVNFFRARRRLILYTNLSTT